MKAIILKCKQGSRFHLGEYTNFRDNVLHNSAEYIHSDVMFGAFFSAMAKIYPDKLDGFKQHFINKKISLSSALYCIKEKDTNKYLFLLPKPVSLNLLKLENHLDYYKAVKKVKFISKGVFEKGLQPKAWFSDQCTMPNEISVFLKEEFTENNPQFSLYNKVDLQKVKVHSSESEGNLFSQTDIMLMGSEKYEVNWYFLLDEQLSNEDKDIFYKTLDLMVVNGIGGERSTGCGTIEDTEVIEDFNMDIHNPSDKHVLLSLAFPLESEADKYLLYKTKTRGGMWYDVKKRLKKIMAVEEGSILNGSITPQIIDLSENNYPYLKYGGNISYPLPIEYINFLNV